MARNREPKHPRVEARRAFDNASALFANQSMCVFLIEIRGVRAQRETHNPNNVGADGPGPEHCKPLGATNSRSQMKQWFAEVRLMPVPAAVRLASITFFTPQTHQHNHVLREEVQISQTLHEAVRLCDKRKLLVIDRQTAPLTARF